MRHLSTFAHRIQYAFACGLNVVCGVCVLCVRNALFFPQERSRADEITVRLCVCVHGLSRFQAVFNETGFNPSPGCMLMMHYYILNVMDGYCLKFCS